MSRQACRCRPSSSVSSGTISVALPGAASLTSVFSSELVFNDSVAVPQRSDKAQVSSCTCGKALIVMDSASKRAVAEAGSKAHTQPVGPTVCALDRL